MTPEWDSKSDPKIGFADRASPVHHRVARIKKIQIFFLPEDSTVYCLILHRLLHYEGSVYLKMTYLVYDSNSSFLIIFPFRAFILLQFMNFGHCWHRCSFLWGRFDVSSKFCLSG